MATFREDTGSTLPEHRVHFIFPVLLAAQIERRRNVLALFDNTVQRITQSDLLNSLPDLNLSPALPSSESAWQGFEHTFEESESGSDEDDKYFLPSADFLPHIAAMAAGRSFQGRRLVRHWRLTPPVLTAIKERKHSVPLNAQALRRLGLQKSASPIECEFLDVFFTAFSSGIGLLHVVVQYSLSEPLDSHNGEVENLIVEANFSVSHRKETYGSPVAKFAESILASLGLERHELRKRRTFAFTAISFCDPKKGIERFATCLALKGNSDHTGIENLEGVCGIWSPSGQVTHAVSAEGGAVVIHGNRSSPFLKDFLRRNSNSYLALARLALHESQAITQYGSRLAALSNLKTLCYGDYSMLGDIRRCLYQYRLNYRFSTVSEEARHNHVHTLWRKSLGIDKLAEEVDADVGQVSAFAEAKRFATLKTLFQVGGSVGAAITGVFGLDAVLNLELRQRMLKRASSFVNDIGATDWISSHFGVSEIFIVLIIICSGWFALSPGRRPQDHMSPPS